MATYKIAPDTQSTVGLAEMATGLRSKTDYGTNLVFTYQPTSMNTLVVNPTTYQADLTSKTWNGTTPLKFSEMFGQTWQDTFTLSFNQSVNTDCSKYQGTVKVNGTTQVTFNKNSSSPATPNSDSIQVSSGDTVVISVEALAPTGFGCTSFFGSDVTIRTGPNAGSLTVRKVISSFNTDTYTFTASSSEKYIVVNSVATS